MYSTQKFFSNSFLASMPGLISIFLSLLAVPLHLNFAGTDHYGQYIFLHLISSFGFFLNFGIGKITTINISKNRKKNKIAYSSISITLKICLRILIFFAFIYASNFFLNFYSNLDLSIGALGILLTVFFVTLESIFQGNHFFRGLMIINLVFYGFSLSLPSIFLYFFQYSYPIIFSVSILIKISVIAASLIYLTKNKHIQFHKLKNYVNFKSSKWFAISELLNQIYYFSDKLLVKFFFGPAALAIYSIPQQLSGKLSVMSKGFSSVLLPSISQSEEKSVVNKNFLLSIKLFTFLVPLLLFLIFQFYDWFLRIWLGSNYSFEILQLLKIFSIVSWLSCLSHLFITYYEGSENVKKNTNIEIYFLPIFLTLVIIASLTKSLIIISFIMLAKEVIIFFLRTFRLVNKITIIPYIYLTIVITCLCLYNQI